MMTAASNMPMASGGAPIAYHRPLEGAEPLLMVAGRFAASADALTSWAMFAGEGRLCVYARAPLAPGGVAKRARQLMAQGIVTLRRTRHEGELFDFAARRTANAFREGRAEPSGRGLVPEAVLLFDLLARYADGQQPCPSNDALAALIGVRGEKRITQFLTALNRANMVKVHIVDRPNALTPYRQFEILETGARTVLS